MSTLNVILYAFYDVFSPFIRKRIKITFKMTYRRNDLKCHI